MKKNTKTLLCGFLTVIMMSTIPGFTGNAKADIPGWTNNGYGWWYDLGDGNYLADGKYPIGYDYYYFDASGYMQTGWVYDEGYWIYFEPGQGNQANSKWIGDYYVDMYGRMEVNTYIKWDDEYAGEYYVDSSGKYCPAQWYSYPAGWSLLCGDGTWAADGLYRVNGNLYAFDENGYMITDSWYYYDKPVFCGDVWFYAGSSGELLKNQWIGSCYVTDNGTMAVDEYIDNYYIDENGYYDPEKVEGWLHKYGDWRFYTNDGAVMDDTVKINNETYTFWSDGSLFRGKAKIYASINNPIGFEYYVESGERAVDEWVYIDDGWYYAHPTTGDVTSEAVMTDSPYWINPGYYCAEGGRWVPGPHIPGIETEMYPGVNYEP